MRPSVPAVRNVLSPFVRWALLALALLSPVAASGQHPEDFQAIIEDAPRIGLEEALERSARENLDLRIAREEAAAALARAVSAGAWSNPGLAAVREKLSDGDLEASETVYSLSQTLEIGGQRGLRRTAALRAADAAAAQVESERLRLEFAVRRTFVLAALAEARLSSFERVTAVVRLVEHAGQARYEEGDVSDFERRRLQVERARYEDMLARERLRLVRAARELRLMVAPDAGSVLLPLHPLEGLTVSMPGEFGESQLAFVAERRFDVLAARAEVEAARQSHSLAARERIPDLTLSGGYKEQSDGFQGGVIGLSIPLPVLDRNAGSIAEAQANLSSAIARHDLVRRRAEANIIEALEAYRSLIQRMEQIDGGLLEGTDGLLETAQIAYTEGEMTLIELLDAADAYRASRELALELLADFLIASFDLERAIGGALDRPETSSSEVEP